MPQGHQAEYTMCKNTTQPSQRKSLQGKFFRKQNSEASALFELAQQPGGTTASIINKHHSTVNSLPTYTFSLFIFASKTTVLFSDTLLDWLDLLSDPFHGSFGIKAEAKVKGTTGTQM